MSVAKTHHRDGIVVVRKDTCGIIRTSNHQEISSLLHNFSGWRYCLNAVTALAFLGRRAFYLSAVPMRTPAALAWFGRLEHVVSGRSGRFVSGEERKGFFALVLREQGELTNEVPGGPVQERRPGRDDNQGEKK
jgi:hypothetical protein